MKLLALFRVPYSEEVYKEFLKFLIGSRLGLIVPVTIIALVIYLLWGLLPKQGLLLWGGLLYSITAARFFSIPLGMHDVGAKQVRRYVSLFVWNTHIYALCWSLGTVFFMPYLSLEYVFFLILLLAGIAMAFVFMVISASSMLVFPCLLLPPAIWLLLQENTIYINLGVLTFLFLFFIYLVARQQLVRFSSGILIHHQNNKLIQKLKNEILEHKRTTLALESSKVEAEQANEAKGEFLSLMSHELRTPIHGIIGMLDLLSDAKLNKEHQENLMLAKQAALSLRAVVNDVLDLSKLNAGKMEVCCQLFSIGKLLDDVMQNFSMRAKSKGLEFYYKIQSVPEKVFSDDIHLRQILLNIIANAVKFTEDGHVAVMVSRSKTRLIIEVEDTGIGIPEEELPSIFDPFKQAHQHVRGLSEGTGLGTSIAQRFVRLLGGDIRVCSKVGEGSTFYIDIPCEFQGEDVCCEVNALHSKDIPKK